MVQIFLYFLLVLLLACHGNSQLECSDQNTREISFLKDSISLKLPVTWTEIDSTRFYDKALVYRRSITNKDTSSFAFILVNDYSIYPEVKLDENLFFEKMKAKMKEIDKAKENKLIVDVIKEINGHKISFLKYKQGGISKNIFNAHIGFILPLKKQVEILIRSADINEEEASKVVDCIFTSLKIR